MYFYTPTINRILDLYSKNNDDSNYFKMNEILIYIKHSYKLKGKNNNN